MKWFKFFSATAVAALVVFGGYAVSLRTWDYSWWRPLMFVLQGFAVLGSQWFIAEEECQEEMFTWGVSG